MKVVIAIDSFKGSLSSSIAGNAVAEGIKKVDPQAEIEVCPIADGGEGTVDALVTGMNGVIRKILVTGPLGKSVMAQYGLLPQKKTAVIEMAQASGLTLVADEERNPYDTTTYGVGEMIQDAMNQGVRRFFIGIGGSATNDGGTGMLKALGFQFLNKDGNEIPLGAKGLQYLDHVSDENVSEQLKECEFFIACDVNNPLCGEFGCSRVFAPQKGATPEMVLHMEEWMRHYAQVVLKQYPNADADYPGAGAAGGMGFAFMTFMNAKLQSGIDFILEEMHIREKIKDADYVITGEGCLDGQTVMGKAPIGVARLAKEFGKPVIAFAGSVSEDAVICNANGIDAYFPILRSITTLEEALAPGQAMKNITDTVEQVFRVIQIKKGSRG